MDNLSGSKKEMLLGDYKYVENKVKKSHFLISNHDSLCDEFNKIEWIKTVKLSYLKLTLLILLSICTCLLFLILIHWFPYLKVYFIYSEVAAVNSNYIFLLDTNGIYHIIDLVEVDLPDLSNSYLLQLNPKNFGRTKLFDFKYFRYIYNTFEDTFGALERDFITKYNNIRNNLSQGLNATEYNYQSKLFGKNELKAEVPNLIAILSKEIATPSSIFQIGSILVWMVNNYAFYGVMIGILFLINLVYLAIDTKANHENISQMCQQKDDVVILRREGRVYISVRSRRKSPVMYRNWFRVIYLRYLRKIIYFHVML